MRSRWAPWGLLISASLVLAACGSSSAPAPSAASGAAPAASASAAPGSQGGGPGQGRGRGQGGPGAGFSLNAAAQYLGLDPAVLRQDLQGGQSLAQVAQAQGKDVEGLEQAMIAAAKANFDQAVTGGKMTTDQEQTQLQDLQQRIDAMVNRTGGQRPAQPPASQPSSRQAG